MQQLLHLISIRHFNRTLKLEHSLPAKRTNIRDLYDMSLLLSVYTLELTFTFYPYISVTVPLGGPRIRQGDDQARLRGHGIALRHCGQDGWREAR
jgi:hypothetical protein